MKKIKILILCMFLLCSTGCTEYMKDGKENVQYKETGQNLTANILCKPKENEDEDSLYQLYLEHDDLLKTKIEDLEDCEDFTPNSLKYEGLWDSFLIKPLAWVILKVGYLVKNMGIAVMLVGLAIRLILLPISYKSSLQSENMKKAQPEINKIEKKYKNKTDNESLMAKSQETMLVYKKYNINPVSGCLLAFIQLPLFLGFLEAINRVPAIFEGSILGMNLGMTPLVGFSHHNYIYIALIALIILSTYFSFKISMSANASTGGEAEKQMQFMFKFMIIMISVASLTLPTAIALYWIVTNGFAVIQTLIIRKLNEKRK
ncbi:MAG: YidC/Oxa1 family membrane protein insertase [Bacilli bacterium]